MISNKQIDSINIKLSWDPVRINDKWYKFWHLKLCKNGFVFWEENYSSQISSDYHLKIPVGRELGISLGVIGK